MRAVTSAACVIAMSGCLVVQTDDRGEDPCPRTRGAQLGFGSGPLAVGDGVYFVNSGGRLSRVSLAGREASLVETGPSRIVALAIDATDLYIGNADGTVVKHPIDGSAPSTLATGFSMISEMAADGGSVAWLHQYGLDRWEKADGTVEHVTYASEVRGFGASDGRYYYSERVHRRLRRTPPTVDLVMAQDLGPLVVDPRGVYYVAAMGDGTNGTDHATAIQMIPREGGTPITIASQLPPIEALAADDDNFYIFTTSATSTYRIRQVSRSDGTVRTLTCSEDGLQIRPRLAAAEGNVYWTDSRGVYRVPRL